MGMIEYIQEIKRQFRDTHGFKPTSGPEEDPVFASGTIPPGVYPMTIEGRVDNVTITEDGRIHCCKFEKEKSDA